LRAVYRDILKHSGIYGVGQVCSRLASFLMLPVYTSFLRPAEYGCLTVLDVTANVLSLVIGAGMATAVSRYHFDARDDRDRDRVWWSGLLFLSVLGGMVLFVAWLGRDRLAAWTLGPEVAGGEHYYTLILARVWLIAIVGYLATYLRVRKWSGLYLFATVTSLVLNVLLNVYFLTQGTQVAGILLGNLAASTFLFVVLLWLFVRSRGPVVFDRKVLLGLWWFGAPLVVTSLLTLIMDQADRYLLRFFTDIDQVGLYSLAYSMGQAVNALYLLPFVAIWQVAVYEIAERPDRHAIFERVFDYFASGLMLVMLGVSLFARPMLALMTAQDYAGAAALIPVVCLAYFFASLHEHFKVPALLSKRTTSLLPAFAVGAVLNVVLNLFFIPRWGTVGAAWATVVSYAAFSAVGLWLYRRIERIGYPLGVSLLRLTGMVATYAGYHALDERLTSTWLSLTCAALCWLVWAAILFGPYLYRLARGQAWWPGAAIAPAAYSSHVAAFACAVEEAADDAARRPARPPTHFAGGNVRNGDSGFAGPVLPLPLGSAELRDRVG
jgi:O-antigen/teichoic acid export membrane protein